MKNIILILVLLVSFVYPQTLIVEEDFEDTTSYVVSEGAGVVDRAYTVDPMQGVYSCYVTASTGSGRMFFASYDSISFHFLLKTWELSTNSAIVAAVYVGSTFSGGMLIQTRRVYAHSGGGSTAAALADSMLWNKPYHVWVDFIKGSGADAICRVYYDTLAARPASPNVEHLTGNTTGQLSRIYFNAQYSMNIIVDDIRVWTGAYVQNYVPHEIYVDATLGRATNDGTINRPYQRTTTVSALTTVSYDSIFLKRGETFADSLVFKTDTTYLGVYGVGNRPRLNFIDPNEKNAISVSNCVYLNGWTWDYTLCPRDSNETVRADSTATLLVTSRDSVATGNRQNTNLFRMK